MDKVDISVTDLDTLKTMADFFLRVNLPDSSLRAIKVILSFYPNDIWAIGMLVRCYDRLKKYEEVIENTENLAFCDANPQIKRAMMMLRARALMKIGKTDESMKLVTEIANTNH